MKTHTPQLPKLAQIAKEAGDVIALMQDNIAKSYDKGNGTQNECDGNGDKWHQKPDGSVVTDADIKANEIVCARLAEHFPGSTIVSEENSEASNMAALKSNDRYETDPLDNTTGYVKGKDGYSVNIGHIVNGVPVDGVIYFPAKRELYYTGDDGKAYLQEGDNPPREIKASKVPLRSPLKVAVGFNEQNVDYLGDREIEQTKLPAQMRTCKIAAGECDIGGVNKGVGGFNTWDIAGPHAVLRAAGGDIVATTGERFRYGHDSVKVPDHIVGSEAALALCVKGFVAERRDIPKG